MDGADLARTVTPPEPVRFDGDGPHVVGIDTGIKLSIVRQLRERGCQADPAALHQLAPSRCSPRTPTSSSSPTAPATRPRSTTSSTPSASWSARSPSSASASATSCSAARSACETYKLPFGHRGANHPVKDLETGRIDITSQNHGFAVAGPRRRAADRGRRAGALGDRLRRRRALPPQPLRPHGRGPGPARRRRRATVQYHPEAGPGPHDARHLFDTLPRPCRMPKRTDIEKILLIGSGPIVIGQAAEFDYSGVQACKVLLEEGYEVVLVNSNPATIMTDPEFATATYIEPLLPGPVTKIIEKERPDALLPTLGGQTALNLAMALHEDGTLEQLRGRADRRRRTPRSAAPRTARSSATTMNEAGLRIPWSMTVETPRRGRGGARRRPHHPAGDRPPGLHDGRPGRRHRATTETELRQVVSEGLAASPINQVLVEESVIGWGEFELEVMRDRNDNVVIICSIENVDPMGVHTGDSVTVAPGPDADRPRSTRSCATRRSR